MKNDLKAKREAMKKTATAKDDLKNTEEKKVEDIHEFVASGCRDKTIRIWEVKTGRCLIALEGHDNWITDMVFHPNGRFLLSVSDDKSIRIWDLTNGRCYRKLLNAHNHFISSIDMRAKSVVTGSIDNTAKVWSCR